MPKKKISKHLLLALENGKKFGEEIPQSRTSLLIHRIVDEVNRGDNKIVNALKEIKKAESSIILEHRVKDVRCFK